MEEIDVLVDSRSGEPPTYSYYTVREVCASKALAHFPGLYVRRRRHKTHERIERARDDERIPLNRSARETFAWGAGTSCSTKSRTCCTPAGGSRCWSGGSKRREGHNAEAREAYERAGTAADVRRILRKQAEWEEAATLDGDNADLE